MTPTFTLNVTYLNWDITRHGDPHEDDPIEVYHPCELWCSSKGIKMRVFAEQAEVKWDDGPFDPIEDSLTIYAEFRSAADAAKFKERWGSNEI